MSTTKSKPKLAPIQSGPAQSSDEEIWDMSFLYVDLLADPRSPHVKENVILAVLECYWNRNEGGFDSLVKCLVGRVAKNAGIDYSELDTIVKEVEKFSDSDLCGGFTSQFPKHLEFLLAKPKRKDGAASTRGPSPKLKAFLNAQWGDPETAKEGDDE
jgi:hypothetical protein